MTEERPQLRQVLTISQAVGLAVTIVVGAGLLALPGLAYQQAGGAAIYVWILDLLIVIPLLVIFAKLGARWPGAGGIAGFLQNGFSRRWGAAAEVLLIGTFGLGIPAIALTGGYYFTALVGGNEFIFAFLLLFAAAAVNWRGAKLSGTLQKFLALALCIVLFSAAIAALLFGDWSRGEPFAPPFELQTWQDALPAAGLVFFAFTGWEMLSFTSEEYKNPRRDFPLAVGISFVLVAVLYLAVAAATQLTLPRDDLQTAASPVAAMLKPVAGAAGEKLVAAAAVVMILANLVGAIWAASRLVFSSAREKLLPQVVSTLNPQGTPQVAVAICCAVFAGVLLAGAAGLFTIHDMLRLAGQNFFFLYVLCVAVYWKTAQTKRAQLLGAGAMLASLLMLGAFGWEVLYPFALLFIGWMLGRPRHPE